MKRLMRRLSVFCFAAATIGASVTQATTYNVNRSFTDGFSTANLTGTVDIPIGNYTIQNAGASPFTGVNLTLTVNATPYNLVNVATNLIFGTGQFLISASPTTLTFNTANGDGSNPADLAFTTFPNTSNEYILGSNGIPAFQAAYTGAGSVVAGEVFPTIFGTAVPEPSTLLLAIAALATLTTRRRRPSA